MDHDRDDFDNPYAPPESTFVPSPPQAQLGTIPFNVVDLFNWTWTLYRERFPICMTVFWGAFAINFGISVVSTLLLTALQAAVRDPIMIGVSQIGINFATWVVNFWLNIGTNLALLKVARRQEVAFEDVFTGGRYLLTTILAWVLFGLSVAAPMFLVFFGAGALYPMIRNDPSALPLFLFVTAIVAIIVVTIYMSIRLMQFYLVIIDRNAGVIESLQTSWSLTRKRVPTLILVYLLQVAIVMAGLLALCVGLVFALPLSSLFLVVTYQALTGQSPNPELEFLDEWDEDIWKNRA